MPTLTPPCNLTAQVSNLPPWFRSLMYVEVFAQLPVFVTGAYAFAARKEWIRVPGLVYSISTVATMVRGVPFMPTPCHDAANL